MILSALFMALVIVLEAGPVYIIFMANMRDEALTALQWLFVVPSFAAVLFVNVFAVYKPMQMGLKALLRYE